MRKTTRLLMLTLLGLSLAGAISSCHKGAG